MAFYWGTSLCATHLPGHQPAVHSREKKNSTDQTLEALITGGPSMPKPPPHGITLSRAAVADVAVVVVPTLQSANAVRWRLGPGLGLRPPEIRFVGKPSSVAGNLVVGHLNW